MTVYSLFGVENWASDKLSGYIMCKIIKDGNVVHEHTPDEVDIVKAIVNGGKYRNWAQTYTVLSSRNKYNVRIDLSSPARERELDHEAELLYLGGWRSTDMDKLAKVYVMSKERAKDTCKRLARIEEARQ